MSNNYTIDYSFEDLFVSLKNKILLEWLEQHHPSIISSVESFLKEEMKNEI